MRRCPALVLCLSGSLLAFLGCGGGGGGAAAPAAAAISVQLTSATTPTTPYTVPQMTVTLRQQGGTEAMAVTDASGVAHFQVAGTGTYEVVQVKGLDVSGGLLNAVGREFVKATPLVSATAEVTYVPSAFPQVAVSASGSYSLNVPVPPLRKVSIIAKASVSAPNTTNPSYNTPQVAGFTGRIVLRDIHFSVNDGIILFGATGSNHFTLTVLELQQRIQGTLYTGAGTALGDVASGVATWPYAGPVVLEVPSDSDWALTSPSATATHSIHPTTFGLLAGNTLLQMYNFGVTHDPAGTNAMAYEVQLFGDPELP